MSAGEWRRGQPIPERFNGMPVTFAWNNVALTNLLRVLEEGYPSGYSSMVDHVRNAMRNYTPQTTPTQPGKYGSVIAGDGREWIRYTTSEAAGYDWVRPGASGGTEYARWSDLEVVRVVNEGVSE